jgi:hypothetical protein
VDIDPLLMRAYYALRDWTREVMRDAVIEIFYATDEDMKRAAE